MPTTIGSTNAVQVRVPYAPHIFTCADGNLVAFYYDGTNLVYRIKSSGTWGAATTIIASKSFFQSTRNGDTFFLAATANNNTPVTLYKCVYSSGAITVTGTNMSNSANAGNYVNGIYYDGTNGLVHIWYHTTSSTCVDNDFMDAITASTMAFAWWQNPATTYANTSGYGSLLVGDGTSTFFGITVAGGTGMTFDRYVSSATTYTTKVGETGTPTSAVGVFTFDAVMDGSNVLIMINEPDATAKLRITTRTAANTFSAYSDIVTVSMTNTSNPVLARMASGDIIAFYRNNGTQANGEIYYIKRVGGTWGSSPGTLLAGGAATGFQTPSCSKTDQNSVGIARVVYSTGTANPFSLVEDFVVMATAAGTFLIFD